MLTLHSDFEKTAVEPQSRNLPMVAVRQLLVGWHDHGTWHIPSILLPDHIIKLVVGNEVHARMCSVVRRNGTDEADRAVPCGRVICKEEFMVKGNRAVCARVR